MGKHSPDSAHLRQQRSRSPVAGGGGNELIGPVRKGAVKVRLDRRCPRGHVPGSIFKLRVEQKLNAPPKRRTVDRDATRPQPVLPAPGRSHMDLKAAFESGSNLRRTLCSACNRCAVARIAAWLPPPQTNPRIWKTQVLRRGPFRESQASEPRVRQPCRNPASGSWARKLWRDLMDAAVTWKSLDSSGGRSAIHVQWPSGD